MSDYPMCTWHSSDFGDYFYKDSKGYIPILKNQSSSITHALSKYLRNPTWLRKGVNIRSRNLEAEEFICVLRDPLDRYISAVCEYIRGPGDKDKVRSKLRRGEFIFGRHSYPQSWFLTPFSGLNVKYIDFNENSVNEVLKFFGIEDKHFVRNKTDYGLKFDVMDIISPYRDQINILFRLDKYYIDNLIKTVSNEEVK